VRVCFPEEMIAHVTDIGRQQYTNPEKRLEFRQIIEEHGYVENFEHEIRRKDGSTIWVLVNARAVLDENGKVLYYEGTHENITERKHAQEKLNESEERYRIAIENSNDGVGIAVGDYHVYVNQKFVEMFGYNDPSEIIGKHILYVSSP